MLAERSGAETRNPDRYAGDTNSLAVRHLKSSMRAICVCSAGMGATAYVAVARTTPCLAATTIQRRRGRKQTHDDILNAIICCYHWGWYIVCGHDRDIIRIEKSLSERTGRSGPPNRARRRPRELADYKKPAVRKYILAGGIPRGMPVRLVDSGSDRAERHSHRSPYKLCNAM